MTDRVINCLFVALILFVFLSCAGLAINRALHGQYPTAPLMEARP